MNIHCIIVDDEPASRGILKKYLEDVPGLHLMAECRDALEASGVINRQKVDLVFLDINMPGLSGVSFARSLSSAPAIIFTTAYPEYAVEGFELNAADYLVKPFSFERFLKAVNRAAERMGTAGNTRKGKGSILVKSEKKIYNINLDDLQVIEGCGDYIKLALTGQTLVVHDTMKRFLTELPSDRFMRVHKSFAIQIGAIEYLEGNRVMIAGREIPVSPDQKPALLEKMKPPRETRE